MMGPASRWGKKLTNRGVVEKIVFFHRSPVGVHKVSNLGEGEKTDADGKNYVLQLESRVEELVKIGKHEIGVLVISQENDVHAYAENEEHFPVRVRGDGRA